jgi:Flp pilus assembly protein TadB
MTMMITLIAAVAAAGIGVACWTDHARTERERIERARAAISPRGTVRAKRPSQNRLYWP